MTQRKRSLQEGFFQNFPEFFSKYKGEVIAAKDIKQVDLSDKKIAVIGTNQLSVTHLHQIVQNAQSVKVFQIKPHFILPHTEKMIHRIISHPLIIKNRRLFNQRVKTLMATRYLESQIQDNWLKRQLMPNAAISKKIFLKSDTYYDALQQQNCKLITWPIIKITENGVYSMEGIEHYVDMLVTTFE